MTSIQQVVARPGIGITVVDAPVPDLGPGDVLIAPEFSYISAGTELNSVRHAATAAPGGNDLALGYSQAGTVLAVGDRVTTVAVGDRVVAVGGNAFHASRTAVGQNLVVALPDEVASADAALAAMFCFAIEAVHKSQVQLGEKVLIFGAGMMGQFAARLYRAAGAEVAVADGLEFRRSLLPETVRSFGVDDAAWEELAAWAKPYGIEHAAVCFGGDATEPVQRLKPLLGTAPDGVPHGRIVFPGGASVTVMMASAMGNIELLSSAKAGPGYRDPVWESGADYPQVYVRHTVRRNVQTMVAMLADGRLSVEGLVTRRVPVARAAEAYRDLAETPDRLMSVLLDYRGAGEGS